MKFKNLFIILSLFKALICGVSPITSTYDDANNYVTGMGNRPVLVGNDDQAIVVDSFTSASNAKRINGHSDVYTVDTNGYIHYASYSAGSINHDWTAFRINPASSALTYSNDCLYIGDDAGILWVFNVPDLIMPELELAVNWCFNASYPIVGEITVDNSGRVYLGNSNGDFFVISKH